MKSTACGKLSPILSTFSLWLHPISGPENPKKRPLDFAWEKYAKKPFYPLEEGMIFTIEPRLEVQGHGIVTIEEMVVIRKNGAEYLAEPQKELLLVN